jgi:hypothetical protein
MFLNETGRYYTLSPVNRAMMSMMLLRSYPYGECLGRDLGMAESSHIKFAAVA